MNIEISRSVAVVFALTATLTATRSQADVCEDPAYGMYFCDVSDSACPVVNLDTPDALRANYFGYERAADYLAALDDNTDFDQLDYLRVIDLGDSHWLDISMTAPASPPVASGGVLAARITEEADERDVEKPAIAVICSIHSLEWAPSEVCLGYINYLVRAANARPPFHTPASNDEVESVREMLAGVEFWIVSHADPGGRMYDEAHGSQYKNFQWRHDAVCSSDWYDTPWSGSCTPTTEWPTGSDWRKLGINVGNAFSRGWGTRFSTEFTRGAIIGQPAEPDSKVIPELYDCYNPLLPIPGPDDAICAAAFSDHDNCIRWYEGGETKYGCFAIPASSLADCTNSVPLVADGIQHTGCLQRTTDAGPQYLLWECGANGPSSNPANDPLLQHCRNGVLYSCGSDANCHWPAVSNMDFDIDGVSWNPPHLMGEEEMPSHLYCSNSYCAVTGRHTCCQAEYGGSRPFEAIETRIIRELVNNVPFSIVLDMHASGNYVGYGCVAQGNGCDALNPSRLNGEGIMEGIKVEYNAAATTSWAATFGGTPETSSPVMPVFLELTSKPAEKKGQGRLGAWASNKVEAVRITPFNTAVDPKVDLTETQENFDLDTVRGIPAFGWELALPGEGSDYFPNTTNDKVLYSRLGKCEYNENPVGAGSKPKSRLLLHNQLEGFKAAMAYLAGQAEVPFVARTPSGGGFPGLNRADVGLLGLRLHDSYGRGLQQSEKRWDKMAGVKGDPTAEILIPAGTWGISFDAVAGSYGSVMVPSIAADIRLEVVDKLGGIVFYDDLFSDIPVQSSERFTRWYDFRTGEVGDDTFLIGAAVSGATFDDTHANNALLSKVRVVDCTDEARRPNGLSADAFCQAGLPFSDSRFDCYETTGRCRECWAGQECEQFMSFCVNGMCDSPATCWSGHVEDDFEGKPAKSGVGLGTHTWPRTMYEKNYDYDEDAVLFSGGDPLGNLLGSATFELTVRVRNLCSAVLLGDEPMDEVAIRIQQRSVDLLDWDDLLDPEWQVPMRTSGLSVTVSAPRVIGLYNGRDLRISVTNPTGEHFAYDLIATIDYAGMSVAPLDPQLPDIPIDTQDEVDVDIELGNFDSFVPTPDPAFLAGHVLFFAPDPDSSPREAIFELYSARGALLRTGTPLDGGLGVSVDGLPEGEGPFSARLYSDDGRIGGSVYLCPTSTVDCMTYDPRRNTCGDACDGASDLCCIDRMTGAVTCADVSSDPENCGGCGVTCEWDEVCLEGVCAQGLGRSCWETVCPEGLTCVSEYWLTRKDPKCRALLVDNRNCGWLNNVCASSKQCVLGLCLPKMGMACDGDCGQEACCWVLGSQTCIDTASDILNCGACGHACDFGDLCEDGACVPWYDVLDPCPFGLKNCGFSGDIDCVNFSTDHTHCGRCRNTCSDSATCEDGRCVEAVGEGDVDESGEEDR